MYVNSYRVQKPLLAICYSGFAGVRMLGLGRGSCLEQRDLIYAVIGLHEHRAGRGYRGETRWREGRNRHDRKDKDTYCGLCSRKLLRGYSGHPWELYCHAGGSYNLDFHNCPLQALVRITDMFVSLTGSGTDKREISACVLGGDGRWSKCCILLFLVRTVLMQ